MDLTRFLWNRLMDFNNTWQLCIPEHNRMTHMYQGSYAQGQGHDSDLLSRPGEGISVVLTVRLLLV